jgi:hypothetical protein
MEMKFIVVYTNGEKQKTTAQFPDFVMFERTWNRSVANLETEIRLTDIGWLAWKSLQRNKLTTLPFEPEWLNSISSVEIDDESDVTIPLDSPAQLDA